MPLKEISSIPNRLAKLSLFLREGIFLMIPISLCKHSSLNNSSDINALQLVTVAYNNSETIKLQLSYIKKYLKDENQIIVGDNSTDILVSDQIATYCKTAQAIYIKLPKNPYNGIDSSKSHGLALNWIFKNLIANSRYRYFGTIDHDIFPFKSTNIVKHLKTQPLYGHIQKRGKKWYLWPGYSFFNKELLKDVKFNFLPSDGLDTGGSNWPSIYQKFKSSSLNIPKHSYVEYSKEGVAQQTKTEIIGDWIHLMNTSGWLDGKQNNNPKFLLDYTIKSI